MATQPGTQELQDFTGMFSVTFPQFKHFPKEVQTMVWKAAIDAEEPRVVEIRETAVPCTRKSLYSRKTGFTSECPIPSVLHACHASRELALKRWRLSWAMRYQTPKIFFDFATDTLYFKNNHVHMMRFVHDADVDDLNAVLNIAFRVLDHFALLPIMNHEGYAHQLHVNFPNLEHVNFVHIDLNGEEKSFIERSELKSVQGPQTDPKQQVIKLVAHNAVRHFAAGLRQEHGNILGDAMYRYYVTQGLVCPVLRYVDVYQLDRRRLEYPMEPFGPYRLGVAHAGGDLKHVGHPAHLGVTWLRLPRRIE
jgi:hypothetical protein